MRSSVITDCMVTIDGEPFAAIATGVVNLRADGDTQVRIESVIVPAKSERFNFFGAIDHDCLADIEERLRSVFLLESLRGPESDYDGGPPDAA